MTVLITLTTAGADTGPFTLYSNVDGYVTPFASGVSKSALLAGYTSYVVPDGTVTVRVISGGACSNYIDIPIYTTTTTTTLPPDPSTATLTFTSYEYGVFTFTLSAPIYSTPLVITSASVRGSTTVSNCTALDSTDTLPSLTIGAGLTTNSGTGTAPFDCTVQSVVRGTTLVVNGSGSLSNGSTVVVGGTLVTIVISNSCVAPYLCSSSSGINALYGTSSLDVCLATPTLVYVPFGYAISTGTTVYTDSGLTTPLVGYTYIVDAYGTIYNINSSTGLVGTPTGTYC